MELAQAWWGLKPLDTLYGPIDVEVKTFLFWVSSSTEMNEPSSGRLLQNCGKGTIKYYNHTKQDHIVMTRCHIGYVTV